MEADYLKQVTPDDFDVRKLRLLAREGRLYIDTRTTNPQRKHKEQLAQVLSYVCAIDECASLQYAPVITRLWQKIVSEDRYNNRLFITKGRDTGRPNRYRIMAIITIMYEAGVYSQHAYTLLDLHHRLQNTKAKDSVYSSRLNYALSPSESRSLMQLLKEILNSSAE